MAKTLDLHNLCFKQKINKLKNGINLNYIFFKQESK